MRLINLFVLALWSLTIIVAQTPVAISQLGPGGDQFLDYFALGDCCSGIGGDTYYFQAWAANSMLPYFPDQHGLPIVGTWNDGSAGSCSGYFGMLQLSKLPAIGTKGTKGNTLITPYPCLTSLQSNTSSWSDHLTGGDSGAGGTWKGANMIFRNGRLLMPVYRQNNAGTTFGDATMIISPDAGQTFLDWSRYNATSVTSATCTSGVITLATTNTYSAGQNIYVHDLNPSVWNMGSVKNSPGKAKLKTANGSSVQYSVSACPESAYSGGGATGPLAADGSAPLGPGDPSYSSPGTMMWQVSNGTNPMVWQTFVSYGQDGSFPADVDPACDPAIYVCGLGIQKVGTDVNIGAAYRRTIIIFRVPVGREMDKSAYLWYYCPGYNTRWAQADTVCDGNQSTSWTSTLANATVVKQTDNLYGYLPSDIGSIRYLPTFKSYLLSGQNWGCCGNALAYDWAPHPWGPFYSAGIMPPAYVGGQPIFGWLMGYGDSSISTNPPRDRIRVASGTWWGVRLSGGAPAFWSLEAAPGRVPFTGMARRAEYSGVGQSGMGHRFVSSNDAGAISRRGKTTSGGDYRLDWWADFWDHGGDAGVSSNRPYFRDVISGGSKYFTVQVQAGNQFSASQGATLEADGVGITGSNNPTLLKGQFADSVLFNDPTTQSWTFVGVFKIINPSGAGGIVQNSGGKLIPLIGGGGDYRNRQTMVTVGDRIPGDVCVRWGGAQISGGAAKYCIDTAVISLNTWYFVAVSAEAQGSGFPIIRMYLGSAGSLTEYGGTNMSTAANGTDQNGVIKLCGGPLPSCTTAPSVVAGDPIGLGSDSTTGTNSLGGRYGEAAVFSGAVPGHVIREIYRTLRTDWARVGRGSI